MATLERTSTLKRNNVVVRGEGPAMMFAHGFGCDQNMWRHVAPAFEGRVRTILFDHVGAGQSDLSAYAFDKYDSLGLFAIALTWARFARGR